MYPLGTIIHAILLVVGILWCKEVVGRWRNDVEELRSGDTTRRAVTILIWLITVGIAFWIAGSLWTIARNIIHAFT